MRNEEVSKWLSIEGSRDFPFFKEFNLHTSVCGCVLRILTLIEMNDKSACFYVHDSLLTSKKGGIDTL